MKILITGAAGAVGSTLVKGMGQRHQLRGFDRVEMPDLADSQVGDVADYDALLAAAEGMEAIIHLTGVDGEWEKALPNNFIGTYNMLEAARIQGVRRVAYASRAGVHGSLPEDVMRHIDMRPSQWATIRSASYSASTWAIPTPKGTIWSSSQCA